MNEADQILGQVRALAESKQWSEIIRLTDDSSIAEQQPKVLRYRLLAAAAQKDSSVMNDVADTAIRISLPANEAFMLVREMGQARYFDIGARLVLDKAELKAEPQFQRAAGRLIRTGASLETKRKLRGAVREASKGGVEIRPAISPIFYPPPAGEPTPIGSVRIETQSSVSRDHVARLLEDRDKFIKQIDARKLPRVLEYHNVFTDRLGQIWTQEGAMIRSYDRPVQHFDPSSVPAVEVALSALSATRGIYHWLVDHAPQVACLAPFGEGVSGIPVLLRDDAAAFERDTLSYLGVDPSRMIRVSEPVFVRRLLVPRTGLSSLVDWSIYQPVFGPLLAYASQRALAEGVTLPRRIYISRSAAKRRRLLNEGDIEREVSRRGFEVVRFEELPLWQQIAVANHADVILAPHGAGLAHLINAKSGVSVIEILPIREQNSLYKLRWNYARLSLARGHRYLAWLEEQPVQPEDWTVDLPEFLSFLDSELQGALEA